MDKVKSFCPKCGAEAAPNNREVDELIVKDDDGRVVQRQVSIRCVVCGEKAVLFKWSA
jgi:ribosomal protein S27AE